MSTCGIKEPISSTGSDTLREELHFYILKQLIIQHIKHYFITKILLKIIQITLSSTFETSLLNVLKIKINILLLN